MPSRLGIHFTARTQPFVILLDPRINSKHTILINIFHLLCIQCRKAMVIFTSFPHPSATHDCLANCRYLIGTLEKHFAKVWEILAFKLHTRLRRNDLLRLGWKAAEKTISANHWKGVMRIRERLLVSVRLRLKELGWPSKRGGWGTRCADLHAAVDAGWPMRRI